MRVMTSASRRWRTDRTQRSPASPPLLHPRTAWREQWEAASSTSFQSHCITAGPTWLRQRPSRTFCAAAMTDCCRPASSAKMGCAPLPETGLTMATRWPLAPPHPHPLACCRPSPTSWWSSSAWHCKSHWTAPPAAGRGGAVVGADTGRPETPMAPLQPQTWTPGWTACLSGIAVRTVKPWRGQAGEQGEEGQRRGVAAGAQRSTLKQRRIWRCWAGLGGQYQGAATSVLGPSHGTMGEGTWAAQDHLGPPTSLWRTPMSSYPGPHRKWEEDFSLKGESSWCLCRRRKINIVLDVKRTFSYSNKKKHPWYCFTIMSQSLELIFQLEIRSNTCLVYFKSRKVACNTSWQTLQSDCNMGNVTVS